MSTTRFDIDAPFEVQPPPPSYWDCVAIPAYSIGIINDTRLFIGQIRIPPRPADPVKRLAFEVAVLYAGTWAGMHAYPLCEFAVRKHLLKVTYPHP